MSRKILRICLFLLIYYNSQLKSYGRYKYLDDTRFSCPTLLYLYLFDFTPDVCHHSGTLFLKYRREAPTNSFIDFTMKEKRKEIRKKEENRITLELHSSDHPSNDIKTVSAFTKDISAGGVRVITDSPFPVGTELKVNIVLSKTRKIVNLDGKVRWVNNLSCEDLFELGIEFMDVSPDESMALLKHIYGDTSSHK